jgi:hypothetical protein
MSRDSLPCPPQMRNSCSLLAHLCSSLATLLGLPRWLMLPQRIPKQCAPKPASYATTYALAQYNAVVIDRAIQLHQACLAQCTELNEHGQRVEAARSTALVKWQYQEDATHTKVLVKEADMQCHQNEFLHAIMGRFVIDLYSLMVKAVSWDIMDDATALLAMKQREDIANLCSTSMTIVLRLLQRPSGRQPHNQTGWPHCAIKRMKHTPRLKPPWTP